MNASEARRQADQAARRRALSPDESFIVQAPAGSGKTELLIQRSLSLLARVEHPSEVLAITFTKKAAGEMRARLLDALVEAAHKDEPASSPARERWHLARAVLAQDRARDWRLLARPALLNIDTFDAFSLRIVALAPMARDSANISLARLEEDASEAHRDAARRAVMQVSEGDDVAAVATLLNALDNRVDNIIGLLADLLAKRAQWIDRLIDDSDEAIEAMRSIIVESVERQIRTLFEQWPHDLTPRTQALAAYAADNLQAPDRRARAMRICDGTFDDSSIDSLPDWGALAQFLLIEAGTWRRQFIKTDGFPAASDKGLAADEKQARTEAKGAIVALLEALQQQPDAEALRHSLLAVRGLPDRAAIAAHEPVLRAALRVLKLAAAELFLIEKSRATTDFSGISIAAKLALFEHRDEVFARLDASISHILVDEFQDTNPAQAALIETLVEPWQPDEARTLFVVGDPMQSIYAFRDADVGIFMDAWSHGLGGWKLTPLTLSANYRSTATVVDWVNASLAPIFAANAATADAPKVDFAPAVAVRAEVAAIDRPELRVYPSARDEARAIVADIARVRLRAPSESIAVMVRAKQHAGDIIAELQAAKLAFTAREMASWSDRPLIRDLLSLSYVLAQPSDRLSWYAWLRSPMIGLTLAAFASLGEWQEANGSEMPEPLFDPVWVEAQDADARTRIELAVSALRTGNEAANLGTLAARVHAVFRVCGGDAIAATTEAKDELEAFLSFIDDQAADGFLPPRDVVEAKLAKQFRSFSSALDPASETEKPVEVLTIHKAKGLEWQHVYLPQLNRISRAETRDLIAWNFVRVRQDYEGKVGSSHKLQPRSLRRAAQLLVGAKESRRRTENSVYQFVHDRRTALREDETKRLLYVAVTRARERLILSVAETGEPRKGSMAALLEWPRPAADSAAGGDESAVAQRVVFRQSLTRLRESPYVPRGGDPPRATHAEPRATAARTGLEPDGEVREPAPGDRDDVAFGIVGHKLIEGLASARRNGLEYAPNVQVVDRWLRREGMRAEHSATASAALVEAVQNMAQSAHFAFLHDPAHLESADELSLIVLEGAAQKALRVDRSFVTVEGVRWIVDYKFARAAGEADDARWIAQQKTLYQSQLARYADAFAKLGPGQALRCALYFPLMDVLAVL